MINCTDDKNDLVVELCGRLPYGVIGEDADGVVSPLNDKASKTPLDTIIEKVNNYGWRPYLYPLTHMNAEMFGEMVNLPAEPIYIVQFYYKHHLDRKGLISKGLAIDATNLNVYSKEV